jgi:cell division protein FtsB
MKLGYGNDYLWGMINAKNQARDLEAENKTLRDENQELKAEIKELKKRISELKQNRK